jgi:hypothetical protein
MMAQPPILSAEQADAAFRAHCLERDSTNLGLLRYRDYQGFLVTGQHSGTHWIKWMLSHALAHKYDVPPPRYYNNASSNDLIGHPKHPRQYPNLPRIASTHTIPPYAFQWGWVRGMLPLPPYVVVVRNIPDVLISNYEKWRGVRYDVDFSTYVAGDPTSKAYVCDVWWYVHFLNRWGEVARRWPAWLASTSSSASTSAKRHSPPASPPGRRTSWPPTRTRLSRSALSAPRGRARRPSRRLTRRCCKASWIAI